MIYRVLDSRRMMMRPCEKREGSFIVVDNAFIFDNRPIKTDILLLASWRGLEAHLLSCEALASRIFGFRHGAFFIIDTPNS